MERTYVMSSNLRSVGYSPESQRLEIEFVSGAVYVYSHVPERVHAGLMMAPSKGSYHHAHIRKRYAYQRIW
jgi:hypothetical protein